MGNGTLLEESNAAGALGEGTLVAGRYRIERQLGKGGMGTVYLARDTRLQDRPLALKFISSRMLGSEGARRRFLTEAMACMDLAHPNIIRVYNMDEWQGQAFLSMEYIQGCRLHELPELTRNNRQLPWDIFLPLTGQVLDALGHAHDSGVIHRDLKPSNILVARKADNSLRAVITDFGLAKQTGATGYTVMGAKMGTPYYMAPEQLRDASQADHRADLFSVGVIACELLTGRPPIGRFLLPRQFRNDLPGGTDEWIERSLAAEADQRFGSAREMAEALRSLRLVPQDKSKRVEAAVQDKQETKETTSIPKIGDIEWVDLGSGAKLELIWVPKGIFRMGSPNTEMDRNNNEGPIHTVELDGFWMGTYEVTQEQYLAVMVYDPSLFQDLKKERQGWFKSIEIRVPRKTHPVERVSWNDAVEFCRKASDKTGKEIRLPTEAEWEYACRAGSTTRFCLVDSDKGLGKHAWYGGNSASQTHPVGKKRPNAWGLYDMHGNVWEWCGDWYAAYSGGTAVNPQGPSSGKYRVLRGGGWKDLPRGCRSAYRRWSNPTLSDDGCGFRVVVSCPTR